MWQTVEGISDVEAVQLDVSDSESLLKYVSEVFFLTPRFFDYLCSKSIILYFCHCLQVDVVLSLLPASCHAVVAKTCIEVHTSPNI